MIYNVAQLLKSPVGTDIHDTIDSEIDLQSDDMHVVGPVVGDVRLQRTNQGVLVTGTFEIVVQLQCVRCLDDFDLPTTIELSDMFMPTIEVVTGRPAAPFSDDEAFPIDARHHLDLTEALRQQIVLALPMQPICREDCLGLCAICGKNRNDTPCNCSEEEDARWSALSQLTFSLPAESNGHA